MDLNIHNKEISHNLSNWSKKPALQEVYKKFYQEIIDQLNTNIDKPIVELGSGIGHIKKYLKNCITTDLFDNEWIDRVENAYDLSFADGSVSNIIMLDVFHHLRYPGLALDKFYDVLAESGRVIIFDPCVSILGAFIYGMLHHEPLALFSEITMYPPKNYDYVNDYYAAQSNAYKIFSKYEQYENISSKWNVTLMKKYSSIAYLLTGGYSKPQLLPDKAINKVATLEILFDKMPRIFATRMMVVLEKKSYCTVNL